MAGDRSISVVLKVDASQYQREMEQSAKWTSKLGDEAEKSKSKQEQATKSQSENAKKAKIDAEAAAQAQQAVGLAFAAVSGSIIAVSSSLVRLGIEYNTLQQSSRAAMTTLMGSAEAANVQMDKLDEFARTSPFSKSVFITAQQQLIGFGLSAEKVIPTLDAVQDATAAIGGNNQTLGDLVYILAQISAAGKITATDLMQFGQRGVDAATLIGSQMGKTGAQIREEITAGTLDAGVAVDALTKGMSEKFGGAAAGVKSTMTGATDRVKAAWRDLGSELAKPLVNPNGGGFLIDVTNGVADLLRHVQALPTPIKIAGAALTGTVAIATTAGAAWLLLGPKIDKARTSFRNFRLAQPGLVSAIGKTTKVLGIAGAAATALGVAFSDAQGEASRGATGILNAVNKIADGADVSSELFGKLNLGGFWGDSGFKDLKGYFRELDKTVGNSWTSFNSNAGKGLDRLISGVGSMIPGVDWRAQWQKASDELLAFGDALTGLADEDLPRAQKAFYEMWLEAGGSQHAGEMLFQSMPSWAEKVEQLAVSAGLATDQVTLLGLATGVTKLSAEGMVVSASTWGTELSESLTEAVTKGWDDFVSLKEIYDNLSDAAEDNAKRTAEALGESADAWEKYVQGVDAETFLTALEKTVQAQEEWKDNLIKISQTASEETVAALAEMGPEGATLVQEFANGTSEQMRRLDLAIQTSNQVDGALAELGRLKDSRFFRETWYLEMQPQMVRVDEAFAPLRNEFSKLFDQWRGFRQMLNLGNVVKQALGVRAQADGGIQSFANGKLPGEALIQSPVRGLIQWAEPETGGEAFIPLAPAKRARSLEIWGETGRRLGVQGFAAGGVRSSVVSATLATSDRELLRAVAALADRPVNIQVDGRTFAETVRSTTRKFENR